MKKALLCIVTALALLAVVLPAQSVDKVDLNTAGVEELKTLPGVGDTTARRIIDYREENGPFRRIEELMNVRGIGEKKFLKLKDRIEVSSPPSGQVVS